MLAAPTLPLLVRAKILEYVQEKAAGLYGGSRSQCRRFAARLSVDVLRLNDLGEAPSGAENKDQVAEGGLCPHHESPSLNDLGEAHRSSGRGSFFLGSAALGNLVDMP